MHEHSPAQASKIDSFSLTNDYVMPCHLYYIILSLVCVMSLSGKEIKTVEFGAKCNNILIDGISFIEKFSFNAFNEGIRLKHCVSLSEKLTGVPVKKISGDQG